MDCIEIRDKLVDYIEGNLEDTEKEIIELHMEGCTECKKEYEESLETAGYLKRGFERINIPQGFMEDVKIRINKSPAQRFKMKKPLKTIFIAAALTILFTITAFAAGGFDFLKWFQEMSIKESKSIEELIAEGYGENVYLSAEDKNVKFTIEKVVADDTSTILSYSIEDLNKEKKYMAFDFREIALFEGEFSPRYYAGADPYVQHSILYSDKPYIEKGMIRLEPVKDEKSTIDITVNQFFYGDEKPFSSVEGTWKLSIPITRYKSKTYVLNKEVDIDGNRVVFKEIKISPTRTSLTYSYKEGQDGYNISSINDIKLIADGKEYNPKYMGTGYYKSDMGNMEITREYDSMYLDIPDRIDIFVGAYTADVQKYAYFDIDVNKPFPQVFDYFGSKISIDDIKIGEERTELTMSQIFGKNKYEHFYHEFRVKGHPLAYDACNDFEKVIYDKYGRKVDQKGMDKTKIKKLEPRTYFIKENIIIEDPPGIEKFSESYHTGELIPTHLNISGYRETRYVNETFTIELDK